MKKKKEKKYWATAKLLLLKEWSMDQQHEQDLEV